MNSPNALAGLAGLAADRVFGEPPAALHPVARFGQAMTWLESEMYDDSRTRGAAFTLVGVGGAAAIGWGLNRAFGPARATALATGVCVAGRMLDAEALRVSQLVSTGQLETARRQARSLVGRDLDQADGSDICRAIIESLAENGMDAVVSSLFWAAVGGAPAVLAHRAVNTLDAMVGHRTPRYENFGWASARLDDLANLLPARFAALGAAAVRPNRAARIWHAVVHDARNHPSPNGGVVEAAFAAALGVRLGGINYYEGRRENRGTLGDGRRPEPDDVVAAVALRRQSSVACGLALAALAAAAQLRSSRRSR